MRFTHTADCHLGGHRNNKLHILTQEAFTQFVTETIAEKADFCLIAGDLFHTAIPSIDTLTFTVKQLQRLKKSNIPVYAIPGSHDYSPNRKSMIDVLHETKLLINVAQYEEEDDKITLKPTKDEKTGIYIVGIEGRRGMLDKELYEKLQPLKEKAIFLFHTALEGCTPEGMSGMSRKLLPENCIYYAGGHIHIVHEKDNIVYPGPLFPNSFAELTELQHGGYWLYEDDKLTRKDIILKKIIAQTVDVTGLTGTEANTIVQNTTVDAKDTIVLLEITGKISSGSTADIDIRSIIKKLEEEAYTVLWKTSGLTSPVFENIEQEQETEDIEATLLEEHKEQLSLQNADGTLLAKKLLHTLGTEQLEGESKTAYEERIRTAGLDDLQERT